MDFDDEADYPADLPVKERFSKYKGLKNFKTAEWNKYVKSYSEFELKFNIGKLTRNISEDLYL